MASTVVLPEVPAQYQICIHQGLGDTCCSWLPALRAAVAEVLNKAWHTGVFLNIKVNEAPGRETVFSLSLTHFPVYFPSRFN